MCWSEGANLSTLDWTHFEGLEEGAQALFLLDIAARALPAFEAHGDVQSKVACYIDAGRMVMAGDMTRHAELVRFLNDPDTDDDFNTYFAQVHEDARACAALDLATYACGFTARISAPAAGVTALPDPVLESTDDIWDYYRDRAALLGL